MSAAIIDHQLVKRHVEAIQQHRPPELAPEFASQLATIADRIVAAAETGPGNVVRKDHPSVRQLREKIYLLNSRFSNRSEEYPDFFRHVKELFSHLQTGIQEKPTPGMRFERARGRGPHRAWGEEQGQ